MMCQSVAGTPVERRAYIDKICTEVLFILRYGEEPGSILGMSMIRIASESHGSVGRTSGHKLSFVA
jgi:hypothetical protein